MTRFHRTRCSSSSPRLPCCTRPPPCARRCPCRTASPPDRRCGPRWPGPAAASPTGHPLTTAAAFATLLKGGNAFDAGVTALLVGGVVEQDLYSLGGEALVLVYPQKEKKVTSIVGQGWAPKAVNVDWYLSRGKTLQGEGLDPAVTPGALHAALTVLEKWGTMSFEQVAAPAIEYAEKGFPMRTSTAARHREPEEAVRQVAGQPEVLVPRPTAPTTSLVTRSSCPRWRAR